MPAGHSVSVVGWIRSSFDDTAAASLLTCILAVHVEDSRPVADLMRYLHLAQDTVGLLGARFVYRRPLRMRN
jgi:hypothetical protein